jgi:hypothetical protein
MFRKVLIISTLFLSISFVGKAQKNDTIQKPELVLELPLFDLPYQLDAAETLGGGKATVGSFFKGYSNPGMHFSLDLSADLYSGAHLGIKKLFFNTPKSDWGFGKWMLYTLTLLSSDFVLTYFPGCDGWEHEEYHRAVMTRFHVNSFNEMNKFPLGAEIINVDHVTDEDLIRFKLESPSDFVRAQAAGIEGEYLLIDKLQRNNFFYNQNLPHELFYFVTTLNSILYVQACSDPKQADKLTDEENAKENTINLRDFTGLDFTGWTYDLFRPNEPYANRGIHPSGIGINRYIKTTDLTSEELSYLKKQGNLQLLNVFSPMMFFIKKIKLSDNGLYGNFTFHHYLTSFGNDISCNIFLMNSQYKFVFVYHSYQNYNHSFPGVEAQMIDLEKPVFSNSFYISPRVIIGLQPSNQEFKSNNSEFSGLIECKIELKSAHFIHPFIEISAKSKGWVAGNEYLNSNISCRFGIISRFSLKGK